MRWGHRKLWALTLVVVAVVLIVGTLLFGIDVTGSVQDTAEDLALDQWISAHHVVWLDPVALGINNLLAPAGALLILGGMAVFAAIWRSVPHALWLLATAAGGWGTVLVLKYLVARPRPLADALANPMVTETGRDSFPSGHTSFAVVLAICVIVLVATSPTRSVRGLTGWVGVLALLFALVVAASRLYVGAHYISDVAASFSATLAGCMLVAAVWVWRHGAGGHPREAPIPASRTQHKERVDS
ncbi:phosphatase PAP2 family protein [Kocuria sp.]|uniref:phosphatase PAP2 family protein n=1 Tax=Kocuria sp. TaxID=1871328 RepID=UPI0026E0146B|nr:phosphatase PAP2 family protein [Kocuria sp.]MDO5617601.1 phosphatase PAP2 family protein [Kocuria sp.]